jgi:membrane protease YdiL (CAAX protease family)
VELIHIVLLGILAFAVLLVGWNKQFFRLPAFQWDSNVYLKYVLIAFGIYFASSLILAPIYIQFLKPFFQPGIAFASWINFLNSFTILCGFAIFLSVIPRSTSAGIFYCPEATATHKDNWKNALFAWFLSFPLVLFLTAFLEYLALSLFSIQSLPDQLAVLFVRMTFEHPLYFLLAGITIIVITPVIEELLFRGFLQSFIRRHLGSKQAILITSICFALFHYSPEQGYGNIPIVGALFALALFLGFLYEKQGSLFASIYLHGLFNAISILNLYFLGGIPCFF